MGRSVRTFPPAGALVVALGALGWVTASGADAFVEEEGLRIPPGQTLSACVYVGPGGAEAQVVAQTLRAQGGSPTGGYLWRLAPGSRFPPGTTVSPLTGVFRGTGSALRPGLHDFAMVVSDGAESSESTFTLAVARSTEGCPVVAFRQWPGAQYDLGTARAGVPFGGALFGRGGTPPYRWLEDTSYPHRAEFAASGLRINRVTGMVEGVPAAGVAGRVLQFRILVWDATGALAGSRGDMPPVYTIRVVGAAPPVCTPLCD